MATTTVRGVGNSSRSGGAPKQEPIWTEGFPLTVAVFEFPSSSEDMPPNYSTGLTKAFRRDEDSEYEYTTFLGPGDLLRAAKLCWKADSYVQSRLKEFYQSRKARQYVGSDRV